MSKQVNPNLLALRAALRELGATVLSAVEGRKHMRVVIRTKAGATFNMAMQRSKIDTHKLSGWLRQMVNRADNKQA